MATSYDAVIVGGGVIGSAVAYFLAAEPAFAGSVLVVERDPSYVDGSTSRSVGGIRQQFATPENIDMSRFAIEFVRQAGEHLGVDGDAPELGFVEAGYLFLATPEGMPTLTRNHALQTARGADVALLAPAELAARFPWLATDDLGGGALGLSGEGWLDAYALLQAFRRKARALGVSYVADEAVGLVLDGGRVATVRLARAGEIGCGVVVNAAGPRAATVAAMAGIDLPVRPRKRFVYVVDCRTAIAGCPLLVDPNGVYVRPEGPHFLCGASPPADADPDCLDLEVAYGLYEDLVWPTLARRIPAFEALKLVRAWAGHYAYNTLDQNALLGLHPAVANLYFANGFSGHGLQQAPAVGRAIAELVTFGAYRTLDLGRLSVGRVVDERPIREDNVV